MAKPKKDRNPHANEPRMFQDGDTVLIVRPNLLWSGCSGTVEGFADGLHRVRIKAKDDVQYPNGFMAEVPGSQLEIYL